MSMLDEALRYSKMNLSVIPVGKDKRPLFSWKEYQDRLATEDEIKTWWTKYPEANIGIVTGKISGITVLDCDSQEAINSFREMYKGMTAAVKTPRGMHFYYKYAEGVRNTVKLGNLDMDVRGEGGYVVAPPSVNEQGQVYKWHSSLSSLNALDSFSILNNIYTRARGDSLQPSTLSTTVYSLFNKGSRDNDLFHVANCLVKGGARQEVVQQVIEILANNCNPPFPENEINAKIQSALDRAGRRERNLAAEVEEYILSTTGNFLSTDVDRSLHLSTRDEKKNLSIILRRLVEKGVIEKHGDRNGSWRKVENDVDVIDWMNAETEEYPVQFPLNIHQLVKLYPGNIAILAGASNTGKTTFMLELIRLNQKRHKILYMNSEMGASELKLRLEMFHEVCPISQWKFQAIERSDKFADAIDPDGFNVIDFMEIYDEFWKLGGWIRDVHKKLNKGIAVIAIQKQSSSKNNQKDFGRGGELTIEKPRLYLAMDRGRIKIVKAKIWRDYGRNPNGLSRDFKIVSGWKFLPNPAGSDWQGDEDRKYAAFDNSDKDFPREE
jgi:hypothetical protein